MIWLGIVQCWATGDKECVSGGLNESVLHRLRHLNAWSPAGATVQEDLEGTPLLEEYVVGGRLWEFKSSHHFPVHPLCFLLVFEYMSSAPAIKHAFPPPWWNLIPLDLSARINFLIWGALYYYVLSWHLDSNQYRTNVSSRATDNKHTSTTAARAGNRHRSKLSSINKLATSPRAHVCIYLLYTSSESERQWSLSQASMESGGGNTSVWCLPGPAPHFIAI